MNTNNAGNITLAALGAIAVVTTSVGIAFTMTTNTTRIADRSQDLAIVQAAAEGAIEQAYGLWKARLAQQNRAITQAEAMDNLNAPTFRGAAYASGGSLAVAPTDAYGAPGATATAAIVSVPGYPGWKGRHFGYVASAKLESLSSLGPKVTYGVKRNFSYTEVPLFQAMFFFEHDFELYRSNTMNITGLTHTNSWAFVSNDTVVPNPVTFQNYASYVLGWTNGPLTDPELSASDRITPYRANTWSGYINGRNQEVTFSNGASNQLNKVARLEPLGNDPASVLDAPPAGPYSPSGQLIGPDGDSDGNPNNDSFHELIERPDTSAVDPPEIAKRRLYNKAGVIVTVNGNTKTVTAQNGTSLSSASVTTIQNAVSTTTIHDKREQTGVRLQNVNLSAIRTTLESTPGFNGVLYVQDLTPTTTSTPKNAIRLQNGGQLPANGLTVASPNGVYIQGDYNTGTTTNPNSVPSNNGGNPSNTDSPTVNGYTRKPAAVIGDAVMILSNAWSDTNSSNTISSRVASNTTVNAALLGGFMPSGYKASPTSSQYGYSGGANNYPRFLENWSGKYFTYFGSMVELFQSKDFTGRWDTGDIYSPPIRCWNYDTNFDTNPPPGSIDAVATSRGAWSRY
jgi:hypothetical protein